MYLLRLKIRSRQNYYVFGLYTLVVVKAFNKVPHQHLLQTELQWNSGLHSTVDRELNKSYQTDKSGCSMVEGITDMNSGVLQGNVMGSLLF